MICRKCRAAIPEGCVYCPLCGAKQEQEARRRLKRANGLGSVYKLPGRRRRPWAAKKGAQYVGFYETKTAALEALNRLAWGALPEKYNYTFANVYRGWSAEHFRDLTASGVAQYERAYNVFQELHARRFRELRTADFQAVLDQHAEQSVSTVGKYKQLITQMSRWAVREEITPTDFATFCKVRGRASVGHEPMTLEEIARLEAAALESEAAKIVCMLLATGMRIGELFALPLADYHESYVIGGEKSAAGRGRIIPIREEGRAFFEYFAAQSEGMEFLLDSYVGNHNVDNFRKRDYYPLLDQLGIPRSKTPHSTRTTYTTRAVAEELAPAALQKVLGHRDFSTTQKFYNKPQAEDLVKAVDAAGKKSAAKAKKGTKKEAV